MVHGRVALHVLGSWIPAMLLLPVLLRLGPGPQLSFSTLLLASTSLVDAHTDLASPTLVKFADLLECLAGQWFCENVRALFGGSNFAHSDGAVVDVLPEEVQRHV